MDDTQWRDAWELFQNARVSSPSAHPSSFPESVDPQIAHEVRSLLNQDERPGIEPGQHFGRYEILRLLGVGGMGEVYAARDPELQRAAALKFLNSRAVDIRASLDGLIAEAQAASALNHPNIVTIYEVIRAEGRVAIAAEMVEGASLRERCGAPVPLSDVIAWGRQIAQGLAAAHARGIVHRDIKPENVMLRPDGYVKILDFGLARHIGANDDLSDIPLGTIGYMAPEQIRGDALTGAADIFALGVMLFELSAGAHPFLADSVSATTTAITAAEPVARGIRPPARLAPLLRSMLAKDPRQRPTAPAVVRELELLQNVPPPAAPRTRRIAAWSAAALLVAASTAVLLHKKETPEQFAVRTVPFTSYEGSETEPAFSPDGSRVAFAWTGDSGFNRDVYVKNVSGGEPVRLTPGGGDYYAPAWSPDGTRVALLRGLRGFPQDVLVIPAAGGAPRVVGHIADPEGYKRPVEWWPDGQSLLVRDLAPDSIRLVRLSLADGSRHPLTSPPPFVLEALITASPDGSRFAFARYDSASVFLCLLSADGKPQPPSKNPCIYQAPTIRGIAWQPDGQGLYYADNTALWLLRLDGNHAKRAVRVSEGAFDGISGDLRHHRLAFHRAYADFNLWRMGADGRGMQKVAASSAEDSEPRFSPDGKKFAFRSNRTGGYELWVADPDGSHPVRLTSLGGHLGAVRWSPDGRFIAFDGRGFTNGPFKNSRFTNIYVVPSTGGPVRRLTDDTAVAMAPSWSRDGRWIYYSTDDVRVPLWKIPVEGGPAVRLMTGPMVDAVESADGRYFYYAKDFRTPGVWRRPVTGGDEMIIPGTQDMRARYWDYRPDGIYFVDGDAKPMLRFFRFAAGRATPIAPIPPHLVSGPVGLSVSPDGKTIIFAQDDLNLSDIMLLENVP